jgi:hypothetical protein
MKMTEGEWNSSTDPQKMLTFLRESGRLTDRKARLFGVACCRRVGILLIDERGRRAVVTAESYADGLATGEELNAARQDALAYQEQEQMFADWDPFDDGTVARAEVSALAADVAQTGVIACHPERVVTAVVVTTRSGLDPRMVGWTAAMSAAQDSTRRELSGLLHCIIGNPFRPVAADSFWLTGNNGTIPRLAEVAYQERQLPSGHLDSARLAILADAVEEAGCADPYLLGHLRGPGPHVRGCFALDLILSKDR